MLMKVVEERDYEIASLKNHIESRDVAESSHTHIVKNTNKGKALPECKRPEQAGKVDDPNYCKYHWVITHPIEKCFMLKELILKLAREKKIELDIDEVAQTNHVAIEMTSSVPPLTQLDDQRKSLIQFGTFEPILVQFQQRIVMIDSQNKEVHGKDDGERWIVVSRKKGR
ncbi:retrotransposon gag protein [Cucumis melo var. makuwa]|uniref:Retrotransposon gag protein n=1 Tax=Cucumis melo var. makuwa TaxID=1194695 RepID=A0A5A7UQG1_CUCMM|nr:retrotransposon gag protein [Cucumis melo var. makuwa]